MNGLLLSVFRYMEQKGVCYCLLRDCERVEELGNLGEIDLLVQDNQLNLLRRLLGHLGFVSLPAWGYAPHHFFLAYDKESDTWLKLDVVTEICYGKPVQAIRTTLAAACLTRRQRCGPVFIPSPEDELLTLLLHCVLDKGFFTPARRKRLITLAQSVNDEPYLSALLALYWSSKVSWAELAHQILTKQWKALVDEQERVLARLAERDRIGILGRQVKGRLLRKLRRWTGLFHPYTCTVALLAPDGAGKSTLANSLAHTFYLPIFSIHMGLYQKRDRVIPDWPVPGLAFARRLLSQWGRYLTARYQQARGKVVIFDRYSYDALLPLQSVQTAVVDRPLNPKAWARWVLAYASPRPDLVVVLDAPGEILYSRKGEHNAADLELQRQRYLALRRRLPRTVVVDATRDADCVRREVTALIWRSYGKLQANR